MARDFGKVRTAFWADEKVAAWTERCKFVALYLLTSPHTNAIGCFRAPAQYIAADTGLSVGDVTDALQALQRDGFVALDERTSYIFLRQYLAHNGIENGKVATHCIRLAEELPRSMSFRNDFEAALVAATKAYQGKDRVVWEGYGDSIERVSKPSRTPEPEKEPEPETEPESGGKTRARRASPPDAPPVSKPEPKSTKGTRWPEDAVVPDDWLDEGAAYRENAKLPPIDLRAEALKFANYWASKSGGNATKTNWKRTWLNWCLEARNAGPNGRASGQFGAVGQLDELRRIAQRSAAEAEREILDG